MEIDSRNATARERYQPIVVGRGEELAELWELALRGRHLVVCGEPGIGKSVLLGMLYDGLGPQGVLPILRVSDSRQFKNALVDLAEAAHARGIYRHPSMSEAVVRSLPWEKLAGKVRALTVKLLAESLVTSLAGQKAILIWDQFDKATPTEISWLHQFLNVATVIVGTTDPASAKLKPILDRIPARIELKELSEAESFELVDRCFEIAPFAVSDVDWYKKEVVRKSRGNPRAIKDLLADHSVEKYVDHQMIRAMASEQERKVAETVQRIELLERSEQELQNQLSARPNQLQEDLAALARSSEVSAGFNGVVVRVDREANGDAVVHSVFFCQSDRRRIWLLMRQHATRLLVRNPTDVLTRPGNDRPDRPER